MTVVFSISMLQYVILLPNQLLGLEVEVILSLESNQFND